MVIEAFLLVDLQDGEPNMVIHGATRRKTYAYHRLQDARRLKSQFGGAVGIVRIRIPHPGTGESVTGEWVDR